MKKMLGAFLFFVSIANVTFAQSALKKAEDTACSCMDEKYDEEQAYKANEKVAEECLMNGFMEHYAAFVEEYSAEKLADEAFTYKLGEKLGTNLAVNCPTFLKFSLQMVQEEGIDVNDMIEEEEGGTVSGEVVGVEEGELTHLVVQDDRGNQLRLLFFSYFLNAETYQDLSQLKGKSVSVDWHSINVYDAKQKAFVNQKEVKALRVD